jgi:hypothetical protein
MPSGSKCNVPPASVTGAREIPSDTKPEQALFRANMNRFTIVLILERFVLVFGNIGIAI